MTRGYHAAPAMHIGPRRHVTAALLATVAIALTPAGARAMAPPDPPQVLPGDAAAASAGSAASRWVVGLRPGRAATALASRAGASTILPGGYAVPRAKARSFAAAARAAGLLVYSEPDRPLHRDAIPLDPLLTARRTYNWRSTVVSPDTIPPPVLPNSPLLAVLDSRIDQTHPEFAGNPNVFAEGVTKIADGHGTATTAVAVAPTNGVGISGVWPGSRAINLSDPLTCIESAVLIKRAVAMGAATINMSYGSNSRCFVEYQAVQFATRSGTIAVASAGNEFNDGNPYEYPASLPHVVTVAATDQNDDPLGFSNANAAVDLSAPGVDITTAVPLAFDTRDGKRDGYTKLAGTSFSAPMVAAAMGWVRQARPDLTPGQVRDTVRLSARDVGRQGWDPSTGYGVLDIDAALKFPKPREDPSEPNDDIIWVDGRAFGQPNPPIADGSKRVSFQATLDQYEDPKDVYRVSIPPGALMRVSAKPVFGDTDLLVYSASAKVARGSMGMIGASLNPGIRRDTVAVRNTGRGRKLVYVVALINGAHNLNSRYALSVSAPL
jgi:hypothetical protein